MIEATNKYLKNDILKNYLNVLKHLKSKKQSLKVLFNNYELHTIYDHKIHPQLMKYYQSPNILRFLFLI